MKSIQTSMEGDTTITSLPLEEDLSVEYVCANGTWFTRVHNIVYPILGKIESPITALISLSGPLRTVWFEFINGKYVLQMDKYYSEEDGTIYDLKDYILIGKLYIPTERNVLRRSISVDRQRRLCLDSYTYRTFDDTVFILKRLTSEDVMCQEETLRLDDTIIQKGASKIDVRCKVFYISTDAYAYWTDISVVIVTKDGAQSISRKEAWLSFSSLEKHFVLFYKDTKISRNILKDTLQIGMTRQGLFRVHSIEKWEYLYSEIGVSKVFELASDTSIMSSGLFYDYHVEFNVLFLVISNSLYISTKQFIFDEDVLEVSVVLLPISSLITVKLKNSLVWFTCTISEGVMLCSENVFR